MKNRLTIIGLAGNILFLLSILTILIFKKMDINILVFASQSILLDIFISLFLVSGLLVPPILLSINLFKSNALTKQIIIPFIISAVLFFLASLQFCHFSKY